MAWRFGKQYHRDKGSNPPADGARARHGWGCKADTELAVEYLSKAAANSGAIEEIALKAGSKKGGAAKGELVLATFELANCFRHGWGIKKDPYAAKHVRRHIFPSPPAAHGKLTGAVLRNGSQLGRPWYVSSLLLFFSYSLTGHRRYERGCLVLRDWIRVQS